jgi:hypothetical protein
VTKLSLPSGAISIIYITFIIANADGLLEYLTDLKLGL